MIAYPNLNGLWMKAGSNNGIQAVEDYLTTMWLDDYHAALGTARADIVQTTDTDFSYLFDIAQERLIAAWGISKGKSADPRPKSRMRGHPMSAGKTYHRGHAIPHSLGGGTDINLLAQKGSINVGPFRVLENKAVNTPGSLYFTYWEYKGANTQTPSGVQQGLLCPGQRADIKWHAN